MMWLSLPHLTLLYISCLSYPHRSTSHSVLPHPQTNSLPVSHAESSTHRAPACNLSTLCLHGSRGFLSLFPRVGPPVGLHHRSAHLTVSGCRGSSWASFPLAPVVTSIPCGRGPTRRTFLWSEGPGLHTGPQSWVLHACSSAPPTLLQKP